MLNKSAADAEQHQVTDNAYRRRRVGGNAGRDHYNICKCPDRDDTGESINTAEEAFTACGFPCHHVVPHHDETLRHEEQKESTQDSLPMPLA